jgi:hypothetical protein
MREAAGDDEFPEILVEGDKHPRFLMCALEDLLVSGVLPRRRSPRGPSSSASAEGWINAFVSDQSAGVDEAGLDVFHLEPGIPFENRLGTIARGEHAEDMLDGQPVAPNDRLSPENVRIDGNPLKELIFPWNPLLHGASLTGRRSPD